jgi:hypothetical protein
MRTVIWNEMYYAKKNDEFISIYISFLKSTKKFFEITILLLTASGFLTWISTKNTNSLLIGLSIGLATFLKLLELMQDKLIANDEYIDDVIELRKNWIIYFDKLEKVWFDLNQKRIDDNKASDIFSELKTLKLSIEQADSDIKLWNFFFLNRKADKLTNNYMTRYNG